jgi:hypothetical protein
MPYATTTDVEDALGRSLTDEEEAKVTSWLIDAGYLIDGYKGSTDGLDSAGVALAAAVTARYRQVSVNMAIRALSSNIPVGASSGSEIAGPFQQQVTYMAPAAGGGVWLSASDKLMLRRVGGGSFTSVQLGSERRQTGESSDVW